MRLPTGATLRASRAGRRFFGSPPLFLTATSLALIVGVVVYLIAPFGKLDSEEPDNRPSGDQIISARDSLDSASTMFSLMSSALTSASGSISKITSSADDIFNAIDTAKGASSSLASGFGNAPNAGAAADGANQSIGAISSALTQAQGLAGVSNQLDALVTPLVSFLEKNSVPGSNNALTQMKELQKASRGISTQLRSLSSLNGELSQVKGSLSSASSDIDSAVSQAKRSAGELNSGLTQLSSARQDTLSGAEKITEGVRRLSGVMSMINNNIESAKSDLDPAEEEVAEAPPEVLGPADRLPWAVLFGAGAALAVLILVALREVWKHLRRRDGSTNTNDDQDPDQYPYETATDGQGSSEENVSKNDSYGHDSASDYVDPLEDTETFDFQSSPYSWSR